MHTDSASQSSRVILLPEKWLQFSLGLKVSGDCVAMVYSCKFQILICRLHTSRSLLPFQQGCYHACTYSDWGFEGGMTEVSSHAKDSQSKSYRALATTRLTVRRWGDEEMGVGGLGLFVFSLAHSLFIGVSTFPVKPTLNRHPVVYFLNHGT